jgi:hypothetical protein
MMEKIIQPLPPRARVTDCTGGLKTGGALRNGGGGWGGVFGVGDGSGAGGVTFSSIARATY